MKQHSDGSEKGFRSWAIATYLNSGYSSTETHSIIVDVYFMKFKKSKIIPFDYAF